MSEAGKWSSKDFAFKKMNRTEKFVWISQGTFGTRDRERDHRVVEHLPLLRETFHKWLQQSSAQHLRQLENGDGTGYARQAHAPERMKIYPSSKWFKWLISTTIQEKKYIKHPI